MRLHLLPLLLILVLLWHKTVAQNMIAAAFFTGPVTGSVRFSQLSATEPTEITV